MTIWGKSKAHYGKPIQLFKDSDKDGVANVFDCKPYNKRKQDVIAPIGTGLSGMYAQREYNRQVEEQRQKNILAQKKAQEDYDAWLKALTPPKPPRRSGGSGGAISSSGEFRGHTGQYLLRGKWVKR